MRTVQYVALAVIALTVTACSSGSGPAGSHADSASATHSAGTPTKSAAELRSEYEAAFLPRLTRRQKLAQLLTVGVAGVADAANVVRTEQVGGLFIGSWTDQALLTGIASGAANDPLTQVKASAVLPLMVTIDEEGGRVSRVKNLIGAAPSARELAKTSTPEQVYQLTLERGRKLKDLGVTVDFAPDADVSSQPANSVIGDRSYSANPETATKYADAVLRGLHDAGIGAVLKHFPGHGSGSGDSHKGSVTTPPLGTLQHSDLVPFRSLVNSGAAVMVGHLDVPGLTAPNVPASISPQVMALLRGGTGYGAAPFSGPIFTDDLSGMAAITDRLGIAAAVEAALTAGADVALWISTRSVGAVLNGLEQTVAAGRLSQARVDESVLRVARYKGALTC